MDIYNILEYGVVANLKEIQTNKIQKVLDKCDGQGGTVVFPAGKYHISSLMLYSDTTIILEKNAQLIASENIADYIDFKFGTTLAYAYNEYYIKKWNIPEYYTMGVLSAANQSNITIIGKEGSKINGQNCYDKNGEEAFRGPMGVVFSKCSNILLQGYEYTNSANWSHQLDSCNDIYINQIKITGGHDGFNLHHCTNVVIENCDLQTGDDCIAGYDIQNLTVKNCMLNTSCNTFRVGGANIIVDSCKLYGPGKYPHLSKNTFYTHSALKYYSMVEEENRSIGEIKFKNCEINEMDKLLSYSCGNKAALQDGPPLKLLSFENCKINKLRDTTCILGNGESIEIEFIDTEIENANVHRRDLFKIDEYVSINFCNTVILGNKKIKEIHESI